MANQSFLHWSGAVVLALSGTGCAAGGDPDDDSGASPGGDDDLFGPTTCAAGQTLPTAERTPDGGDDPQRPNGDDEMSFWTFFVLAIGVWALASCAAPIDSSLGGDGGSGDGSGGGAVDGDGGSGAGSTAVVSSSSASAVTGATASSSVVASVAASSSSGGQPCDSPDPNACGTCQQCAVTGVCSAAYGACQNSAECVALNGCLNGCMGDVACEDACATAHPMGQSALAAAANCVYCQACYQSCNGMGFGCQ